VLDRLTAKVVDIVGRLIYDADFYKNPVNALLIKNALLNLGYREVLEEFENKPSKTPEKPEKKVTTEPTLPKDFLNLIPSKRSELDDVYNLEPLLASLEKVNRNLKVTFNTDASGTIFIIKDGKRIEEVFDHIDLFSNALEALAYVLEEN